MIVEFDVLDGATWNNTDTGVVLSVMKLPKHKNYSIIVSEGLHMGALATFKGDNEAKEFIGIIRDIIAAGNSNNEKVA